jgi:hypothetical protein
MFGIDTQETMPEAFLTDHAAWDGYIGHIWYNILSFTNFTKESCVVDIAPGSSIKLGAALAKFGYRGDLYIVDASTEALEALKKKYADILPQARIHWLCGPLREQAERLPRRPDYLLGNHILDDMILAASDAPQEQKNNFSWASAYEHAPTAAFQKSWQRLLSEPALLACGKKTVEDELTGVVKSLDPCCFILNQYPSSTLYDHGMGAVNDHAFAVFETLRGVFREGLAGQDSLQTLLNANRHFGNAHIGDHVLNAKYWMLWRPKKI